MPRSLPRWESESPQIKFFPRHFPFAVSSHPGEPSFPCDRRGLSAGRRTWCLLSVRGTSRLIHSRWRGETLFLRRISPLWRLLIINSAPLWPWQQWLMLWSTTGFTDKHWTMPIFLSLNVFCQESTNLCFLQKWLLAAGLDGLFSDRSGAVMKCFCSSSVASKEAACSVEKGQRGMWPLVSVFLPSKGAMKGTSLSLCPSQQMVPLCEHRSATMPLFLFSQY